MLLCVLAIAGFAPSAHAQTGIVDRLPAAPLVQALPQTVQRTQDGLQDTLASGLAQARQLEIKKHLRLHRDALDTDGNGAPVLRSEVVAIDPDPEALERARHAGFSVIGDRVLDELGLRVVVLRSPQGTGTRAALRQLRRLDPAGSYDFNHVYFGSAAGVAQAAGAASTPSLASQPIRIGLIDSGVERDHPALTGIDINTWGCEGKPHPDAHGTAVASLLVGDAAGSVLYSADIYCGRPTGGAVAGFAEAMAWMARERVGVINLSLVGPDNRLLHRAVQALAARGHVLVAAVGNDGPAAPPLFPAAYPEVIGVTAVDRRHRALPEAGRGRQVDFAAPGSELRVALPGRDWGMVRGTSFAAPLVARAAASLVGSPVAQGQTARIHAQLVALAVDLGPKGRDNTYGHGLLDAPSAESVVGAR